MIAKNISIEKFELQILALGIEDYIGIWEIFWYLRGKTKLTKNEYFILGVKIIQKLFMDDFIDLFQFIHKKEFIKIDKDAEIIKKFLSKNKKNIFDNKINPEVFLWMATNKKGKAFYLKNTSTNSSQNQKKVAKF